MGNRSLLYLTFGGVLAGVAVRLAGARSLADGVWALTTAVALVVLGRATARDLRKGDWGVDLIALLAMAAALATGEYLAGAVVALMMSGGSALETFAAARAGRELSALLERAPRVAHRYEDGRLSSPDPDEIRPGDLLLVKPGEIVPVDGLVAGRGAVLDESAMTGESAPVSRGEGEIVRSGVLNAGGPFDLRAIATAAESAYAGIVRLVREAQASKAPFVRLADRYAVVFLPVTLLTAALAWGVSGDARRALAVLVVATPCPLILAAPVAILSGVSRAARRGVIVKGGRPLEALARASVLLMDKTGTVTSGAASVSEILAVPGGSPEDLLRLAASLDQVSHHVLAAAILRAARSRGLPLAFPTEVEERAGDGIRGRVDGAAVAVGRYEFVGGGASAWARRVRRRTALEGTSSVFVSIDGRLAGALILHDPIRVDARRTVRALRRSGIRRIVLVTGDHPDVAETVGIGIGADLVLAERSPEDKVEAVRSERAHGPTVMVGDGINDAPALAAADVGVALGARGATASSQAADVVLTVDRLDRLAEAIRIARRSRGIALESVSWGMGLSLAAMIFAAAGHIAPVPGALLQEGIDVAVILNSLRALGERRDRRRLRVPAAGEGSPAEHERLLPDVNRLRSIADRLGDLPPRAAREQLEQARSFLEQRLLPHERAEDAAIYPVVARLIGGEDPTSTMSRAHLEIAHLARLFGRLLDEIPEEGPAPEDLHDLRRVLYGLHAILRLHFAQEEEHYFPLLEERTEAEHGRSGQRR